MKNYIAVLALGMGSLIPASATQFIFEDFEFSLYDSKGQAFPSLEDNLQLGMFSAGFTPTASNLGNWQSNWLTDSVGYYDSQAPEWSSSLSLNDNSVFAVGQQLSLWLFDSTSPSGEWALFTDPAWLITTSSALDINPVFINFTEQTQALYGSIDFDAKIAATAAIAGSVAVPEPSTYGIVASVIIVGLAFYRRKTRQK